MNLRKLNYLINILLLFITTLSINNAIAQAISRVSESGFDLGLIPDAEISSMKISANGRYITFISKAANLVEHDTNLLTDLFILDTVNENIKRVNLNSFDAQMYTQDSRIGKFSRASDDGRFVAFGANSESFPGYNGEELLYLKDLLTGELTVESIDDDENPFTISGIFNTSVFLSDDAQFVYFSTEASLTANDANNSNDVFKKDLSSGAYELLSVASNGFSSTSRSLIKSISSNGRYMVFESSGSDIVSVPNAFSNLYLRDTVSATNVFVNVTPSGESSYSDFGATVANVSNLGHVIYCSGENDLVVNDTNGISDVFIFFNGVNKRISLQPNGDEITDTGCESFEGVYQEKSFSISSGGNIASYYHSSDQLSMQDNNGLNDVYSYNIQTENTQLISSGNSLMATDATSSISVMSENGSKIAFLSDSNSLVEPAISTIYNLIYSYDRNTQNITLSSQAQKSPSSIVANALNPKISQDQKLVIYSSKANNVIENDENKVFDLFLNELELGTSSRIASHLYGVFEQFFDISPNGHYVTFVSQYFQPLATIDLGQPYIYLYDINNNSYHQIVPSGQLSIPKVNNDGTVVFQSDDDALVANDNNGHTDVFLYNHSNQSIEKISNSTTGLDANNISTNPDIGGEGIFTWVTFESEADNLIIEDNNDFRDVFIFNWPNGEIWRVTQTSDQGVGGDDSSYYPYISDDSKYISYYTDADNLTSDETPKGSGKFMRYTRESNLHEVVTIGTDNSVVDEEYLSAIRELHGISSSGRYVSFVAFNDEYVDNDTNDLADLFIRDMQNNTNIRVSLTLYEQNQIEQFGGKYSHAIVEDTNLQDPLIGVVFVASQEILEVGSYPGVQEIYLYQQGGDGVTLNMQVQGDGMVSGTLAYQCSGQCSDVFDLGTQLLLVATPAAGQIFTGWQGDECNDSIEPTCEIFMNQNKNIRAIFLDNSDRIFTSGFE